MPWVETWRGLPQQWVAGTQLTLVIRTLGTWAPLEVAAGVLVAGVLDVVVLLRRRRCRRGWRRCAAGAGRLSAHAASAAAPIAVNPL